MTGYSYSGNYHTHTQWCNHGTLTTYQAIEEAINAGMTELGFSEHAPFPDDRFYRMKYAHLNDYMAHLDEMKLRYADRLSIKKGLEIEFFPDDIPYYEELLSKCGADYLILGQHHFCSGSRIVKTKLIEATELLVDYADSLAESMDTGLFMIVAHPDYCFSCDLPLDKNGHKAMETIIKAAERNGTILEINANGFRKPEFESCLGLRRKYPFSYFWESAASHNVRCIIGSDAHHSGCIFDDAVKTAFDFAKSLKLPLLLNNTIQ